MPAKEGNKPQATKTSFSKVIFVYLYYKTTSYRICDYLIHIHINIVDRGKIIFYPVCKK